jgi:hypothetical protein
MKKQKRIQSRRQSRRQTQMKTRRQTQMKTRRQKSKHQNGGEYNITFQKFISYYDFNENTFYYLIKNMITLLKIIRGRNTDNRVETFNFDLSDNIVELDNKRTPPLFKPTPLNIRSDDESLKLIVSPQFNVPFSMPFMTYLVNNGYNFDNAVTMFENNTDYKDYKKWVGHALVVGNKVISKDADKKSDELLKLYFTNIYNNYKSDPTKNKYDPKKIMDAFKKDFNYNVDIWGWIMLLRHILLRGNKKPASMSSNVWLHSRKVIGELIIYTITDGAINLDIDKILHIINKIFEPSWLKRRLNKTSNKVIRTVGNAVSKKLPPRIHL